MLNYLSNIPLGDWIKASHEAAFPAADWAGLTTNLGSDFSLNKDQTGITGVDGLTINSKGEATFSVDGKTKETVSINDIHTVTKDINGQPIKATLLVSGYAWNAETKSWDVYNPGFPMDIPKDELGWFNQADIANGNWLRWYQRATANVDWKTLFANSLHPDSWKFVEDGTKYAGGVSHFDALVWANNDLTVQKQNPRWPGINKNQYPAVSGSANSYMIDSNCVIISFNALNGDGTTTALPLIMDDTLWLQHRNDANFTRAALAANVPWNSTMAKEETFGDKNSTNDWQIGPEAKSYPDETITMSFGTKDIAILKNPNGTALRESSVNGNMISDNASLIPWGGLVGIVPH